MTKLLGISQTVVFAWRRRVFRNPIFKHYWRTVSLKTVCTSRTCFILHCGSGSLIISRASPSLLGLIGLRQWETCQLPLSVVLECEQRLRFLKLTFLKSGKKSSDLMQAYKIFNHSDNDDNTHFFTLSNFDKRGRYRQISYYIIIKYSCTNSS